MGRFLEDLKKTRHKHIEIKMRLTHMLRKQMPYPITKGARFMALDWDFILKRSHYVRGFLLSIALCGVPVFFQVRKVEIAFHENVRTENVQSPKKRLINSQEELFQKDGYPPNSNFVFVVIKENVNSI